VRQRDKRGGGGRDDAGLPKDEASILENGARETSSSIADVLANYMTKPSQVPCPSCCAPVLQGRAGHALRAPTYTLAASIGGRERALFIGCCQLSADSKGHRHAPSAPSAPHASPCSMRFHGAHRTRRAAASCPRLAKAQPAKTLLPVVRAALEHQESPLHQARALPQPVLLRAQARLMRRQITRACRARSEGSWSSWSGKLASRPQ
jgi:hypothetical protein